MSISKTVYAGTAGFVLLFALAGCEIAAGAAIGAGAGAIAADATDNDVQDGAAVGGLLGAGVGALN